MFIRFDRIHERDGQTDRHHTARRQSIAPREKKHSTAMRMRERVHEAYSRSTTLITWESGYKDPQRNSAVQVNNTVNS